MLMFYDLIYIKKSKLELKIIYVFMKDFIAICYKCNIFISPLTNGVGLFNPAPDVVMALYHADFHIIWNIKGNNIPYKLYKWNKVTEYFIIIQSIYMQSYFKQIKIKNLNWSNTHVRIKCYYCTLYIFIANSFMLYFRRNILINEPIYLFCLVANVC